MNVRIDSTDFEKKMTAFLKTTVNRRQKATRDVASEVLRLSQYEVPHDIGTLQNSGFVEDNGDESIVGYNTVYAARLHENPQFAFQKGRKGKYLEDLIKHNLRAFRRFIKNALGEGFE